MSTMNILQAILARLEALEKKDNDAARMPPPRQPQQPFRPADPPAPQVGLWPTPATGSNATVPHLPSSGDGFTLVERKKRRGKGPGKSSDAPATANYSGQVNITQASYASTASAAAHLQQPPPSTKAGTRLPTFTEVTVVRAGGHVDPLVEQYIRSRTPDAIVREIKLKMARAVASPIPLMSGRWSVHPRSKGNFVFSFNGCIPFDAITPYEHILLAPFQGSGQLRPSLGWTRLLVHGVPFWGDDECVFSPDALLAEVSTLPGLKKAAFAMEPRWLKPVWSVNSTYSTITFAISDPDGSITSTLEKSRTALFGKEVIIRRWIDKPALVQCSRCHSLGHTKTSKACSLGRDSVKCFICGQGHPSDQHNQQCKRKHAVAGVCDCTHFKCLNCQQAGHHCRDKVCPARAQYRPRARIPKKFKGKGKARDWGEGQEQGQEPEELTEEEYLRLHGIAPRDADLYLQPREEGETPQTHAPQPGPSGSHTAPAEAMVVDSGNFPAQAAVQPLQPHDYSPSRPQDAAANLTMT
jgi:hypothetical protein